MLQRMSFSIISLLKSFKVNTRSLDSLVGVVKDINFNNDKLYVIQNNKTILDADDENLVLTMKEYCSISTSRSTVIMEEMKPEVQLLFRILKTCINRTKMDVLSLVGKKFEEEHTKDPLKKWIKELPLKETIHINDYNNKELFKLVANVVLDNEEYTVGKNKGAKKRNTLIKFEPCIPDEEFNCKSEWLYIISVNDRVVKIGGTRTGLAGRVGSYLCGHHVQERGKSGDCSKTNGYIYNTLEFYLRHGSSVKMYGYELPKTTLSIEILNKPVTIIAQTYHAYESRFMEDFKSTYGYYPVLCDNSDPDYKN